MTEMMQNMSAVLIFTVLLGASLAIRLSLSQGQWFPTGEKGRAGLLSGVSQTTGNQEVQADCVQVVGSRAGTLAVMADGIGRKNTGAVCAQIAADTLLDRFEPYQALENPEYFFRAAFSEANLRIQRTLMERRGGACLMAAFFNGETFHYALAGDIRIALLRGGELIPISKGQTLDVLALKAYEEGRLSKQEAIWSMEEKRIWNYLGQDGFHEIEVGERPIHLKAKDQIFIASKGIWQELSWAEIEDILADQVGLQEKAERIVAEAERKTGHEKENGSVLLLEAEGIG